MSCACTHLPVSYTDARIVQAASLGSLDAIGAGVNIALNIADTAAAVWKQIEDIKSGKVKASSSDLTAKTQELELLKQKLALAEAQEAADRRKREEEAQRAAESGGGFGTLFKVGAAVTVAGVGGKLIYDALKKPARRKRRR